MFKISTYKHLCMWDDDDDDDDSGGGDDLLLLMKSMIMKLWKSSRCIVDSALFLVKQAMRCAVYNYHILIY